MLKRLLRCRRSVRFAVLLGVITGAAAASLLAFALFSSAPAAEANAVMAATLSAPTTLSATASSPNVTVNWDASTLSDGTTYAQSYTVERYDGSGSDLGPACGGATINASSGTGGPPAHFQCTDSPGAAGTYEYKITAQYFGWTATSAFTNTATTLFGTGSKLVFTTQPSTGQNVTAGAATTFKVSVEDSLGNVVASDNSTTVNLAIAAGANPGGSTLSCTNANGTGPVTVASGVATFTCSLDKAGSGYELAATDSTGGGSPHPYTGATSNSFNIVAGAATTLVVTGYPTSTVVGANHSFTVTAEDGDGNTATTYTGTVSFTVTNDSAAVPPANYQFQASDDGVKTFNMAFETVDGGSKTITATDTVDSSITGSESGIDVTKDSTTTMVTASPATVAYGNESASMFTVTVATNDGEPLQSSESVTVDVGITSCIATVAPMVGGGVGVCTIGNTALPENGTSYAVSATYNGDDNVTGSSGTFTDGLTVNKDSASAVVTGSASATYGNEIAATFTVTVTTGHGEQLPSTDSVTINVGSSSCIASVAPGGNGGSGSCSLSSSTALPAGGPYTVLATYAGDADVNAATPATLAGEFTVNKDSTSAVVTGSSSATYGNETNASFTVTVTTGNLETLPSPEPVMINVGNVSCTADLMPGGNGGSGSCSLSSNTALPANGAPYLVTATYSGDTDLAAAAQAMLAGEFTVNPDSSSAVVTASSPSAMYGNESVPSFTVTVTTGNHEALSSPDMVMVHVGSASCDVTLTPGGNGGSGSCSLSSNTALNAGAYSVTATYGGDANATAASMATLAGGFTVTPDSASVSSFTVTGSPATFGSETSLVFSATVSSGHGEGIPNGDTVSVTQGATPICTITLNLGTGTCSPTNGSVLASSGSPYTVTATFNAAGADTNFVSTATSTTSVTINTAGLSTTGTSSATGPTGTGLSEVNCAAGDVAVGGGGDNNLTTGADHFNISGPVTGAVLASGISGSGVTTLTLTAAGLPFAVTAGDTLNVGPAGAMDTFKVASSASAGATTVSVNTQSGTATIPAGSFVFDLTGAAWKPAGTSSGVAATSTGWYFSDISDMNDTATAYVTCVPTTTPAPVTAFSTGATNTSVAEVSCPSGDVAVGGGGTNNLTTGADHYTVSGPVTEASLASQITGSSVTTLTLSAPGLPFAVAAGDTLNVGTPGALDTFKVATSAAKGATTVSVNTQSGSATIPAGSFVFDVTAAAWQPAGTGSGVASTSDGWYFSDSSDNVTATAYVICVPTTVASPTTVYATAPNTTGIAEVNCPAGDVAEGGGGNNNETTGVYHYNISGPVTTASLASGISGSSVTTLTLSSPGLPFAVANGDTLYVGSGSAIDTFTVNHTGGYAAGATSITVNGQTGSSTIPAGSYVFDVTSSSWAPPGATSPAGTLGVSYGWYFSDTSDHMEAATAYVTCVPSGPQAPSITSANTTTFTKNTPGSFTVTTSGYPTASITDASGGGCTASTLPGTVTFTDNGDGTATISGNPGSATGSYTLCLTASNGVSPAATQTFDLIVSNSVIVYEGVGAVQTWTGDGTENVSYPSATQPGDLLLLVVAHSHEETKACPSGWTQRESFSTNNGSHASLVLCYKFAVSGESGSSTVAVTESGASAMGYSAEIVDFRNVNQTTPFDVADVTTTSAAGASTFSPTGLTTVTANAMAVSLVMQNDSTSTQPTLSLGTANGFGFEFSNGVQTSASNAEAEAHESIGTAGAVTFPTWASTQNANANEVWLGISFALRPVSPTAPTITSGNSTTFSTNTSGSFTVTTSGYPTPSIVDASEGSCTASTLPGTVAFTDNSDGTATLSGNPGAATGSYTLCLTASNGVNPAATQPLTLTVSSFSISGVMFSNIVMSGGGAAQTCTTQTITASIACTAMPLGPNGTFTANVEMVNASGTPLTNTSGIAITVNCLETTINTPVSTVSPASSTIANGNLNSTSTFTLTGGGGGWKATMTCSVVVNSTTYQIAVTGN